MYPQRCGADHPGRYAAGVAPAFFFALIGIWAMWLRKDQRRALSLLCMTILSFAIGYSFFWAKTRYRLPVEPHIIILSAYGLRQMWSILAGQMIRERLCRVRATEYEIVYPQPTDPSNRSGSGAIKSSFGEPCSSVVVTSVPMACFIHEDLDKAHV